MKENSQWLVKARKPNGEFEVFKFAGIMPRTLSLRAVFVYDLIAKAERRCLHSDSTVKITDFADLTIPWVNMEWMQHNGFAPGISTKARAAEQAAHRNDRYEVYSSLQANAFFFVNDYCYGLNRVEGQLPQHWVPCSFGLPMLVAPREGLPDGIVRSIDDWIFVFENGSTLIESEDQLKTILQGDSNG